MARKRRLREAAREARPHGRIEGVRLAADAVGANLAAYAVGSPAAVTQAHVTRGVVTQW